MEVGEAGLASRVERRPVHERDHQHLAAIGVLSDCAEQPGGVELRPERAALFPRGHILGIVGNRSNPFGL